MKAAVFGASGWLGENLVRHLGEKGDEVTEVRSGTELGSVDVAYYLISTVNPSTAEGKLPTVLAEEKRLLHSALALLPVSTKFIFASSGGAVYGDGSQPHLEGEDLHPRSDYGRCKQILEDEVLGEAKSKGRSASIARIANPYGPWPKRREPFGIINTAIDRSVRGEPLSLFGEGTTVRDFLHVEDVASALRWMADLRDNSSGIYNVGSGKGRSLAEVIEALGKFSPLKVEKHPERPFDVRKNVLEISRLESLGWSPKREFLESLRATWEWRKSW